MLQIILSSLSLGAQLTAVFFAVKLLRVKSNSELLLMITALVLMLGRRITALSLSLEKGISTVEVLDHSILPLTISLCFAVGLGVHEYRLRLRHKAIKEVLRSESRDD